MGKTRFNINNPHHRLLAGTLSMFIDDFGYSPRELYELIDSAKKALWHTFREMANEKRGEVDA